MQIIIVGPPGVGKGTQAKILTEEYQIPHISTGDILRGAIAEETSLGKEAQTYNSQGKLVPDHVMLELVKNTLQEDRCKNGFILDGFPRTIPQAEGLDAILADMNRSIDCVLVLELSREVIIKRLSNRRFCVDCGTIYNLQTNPPVSPGICDRCGGELIRREDDEPDTINHRVVVYEQQTVPLISFYRDKDVLRVVNGFGTINEVQMRMKKILDPIYQTA